MEIEAAIIAVVPEVRAIISAGIAVAGVIMAYRWHLATLFPRRAIFTVRGK